MIHDRIHGVDHYGKMLKGAIQCTSYFRCGQSRSSSVSLDPFHEEKGKGKMWLRCGSVLTKGKDQQDRRLFLEGDSS